MTLTTVNGLPTGTLHIRPPIRSEASRIINSFNPSDSRYFPAARPAIPPPMMTILGCRFLDLSWPRSSIMVQPTRSPFMRRNSARTRSMTNRPQSTLSAQCTKIPSFLLMILVWKSLRILLTKKFMLSESHPLANYHQPSNRSRRTEGLWRHGQGRPGPLALFG